MANAVWPSTLPQVPDRQGNSEGTGEGRLFSPMAQGPAKVRRATTANVRPFAFPCTVDATQLATFLTFYNTTLQGGALPFDYVNPRTGATESARIGQPAPVWVQTGDKEYLLTLALELLP